MPFPLPRQADARIDISPLIDVVFQLLIFFVVTTTFLTDTGIPLELPEAASGQNETIQEEMSVRVARDGGVRFQGDHSTGVSPIDALIDEFALRRKDLNSAVFTVGNENPVGLVDADSMWDVELRRGAAGFAPRLDQLAST